VLLALLASLVCLAAVAPADCNVNQENSAMWVGTFDFEALTQSSMHAAAAAAAAAGCNCEPGEQRNLGGHIRL
jgi:hypothetical protein